MVKINNNISVAHPNSVWVVYKGDNNKEIKTIDELKSYIRTEGNTTTTWFSVHVLTDRIEIFKRFVSLLLQFRTPRITF